MGYLGRRIGLSQDQGDSNPGAAGGAVGGGLLDLFAHGYFERQGDIYNVPGATPQTGLTATGGVISDYTSGSDVYRAHIFTSSGELDVTALSENITNGDTVEYLVVAGGGGAGSDAYSPGPRGAAGGGAGGIHSNHPDMPSPRRGAAFPVSVQSYPVVIGGGGVGGVPSGGKGVNGGNSNFSTITSTGGGAGGGHSTGMVNGNTGGSGGGATNDNSGLGVVSPSNQGFAGGNGATGGPYGGGGGGGAGGVGTNAPNSVGGNGGPGIQIKIAGPPTYTGTGALNPGPGESQWFGGGGAGYGPAGTAGVGGGGIAGPSPPNNAGTLSGHSGTGGGGGGTRNATGGAGGSGIVVVRYKIAEITATAKATGGAISFHGGKTIHTFTSSGAFTAPSPLNPTPLSVEYFMVGSGGAGGAADGGGGGGAGGIRTNIGSIIPGAATGSSMALTAGTGYPVSIGAGGARGPSQKTPGSKGGDGGDVVFNSITAGGGGGGGSSAPNPSVGTAGRATGGSGGGGGSAGPYPGNSNAGGAGNGHGYAGGASNTTGNWQGGGGGGAGEVGNTDGAGYGGDGLQLPSTYRSPLSTIGGPGPGSSYGWFGGGGGGGAPDPSPNTSIPQGGVGGGGNGECGAPGDTPSLILAQSGSENTGGGGGGKDHYQDDAPVAGNGGSGIVIIAYTS